MYRSHDLLHRSHDVLHDLAIIMSIFHKVCVSECLVGAGMEWSISLAYVLVYVRTCTYVCACVCVCLGSI